MRIERLVFVRNFEVTRHVRRSFRVSVWRRVRGRAPFAVGEAPSGLWSAGERAMFAAAVGSAS
jgi:hypothetical protein